MGGVYHPRAKGGAMSDALADARRAMARLMRMLALRGAGLLLFAGGRGGAGGAGQLFRRRCQPEQRQSAATSPTGWARWARSAADLLLQIFGFAALAFLAPLFVWGARALRGKHR